MANGFFKQPFDFLNGFEEFEPGLERRCFENTRRFGCH
jgi:hypothetical protein